MKMKTEAEIRQQIKECEDNYEAAQEALTNVPIEGIEDAMDIIESLKLASHMVCGLKWVLGEPQS